jgi:6-phosphogluconolactonase
VSGERVLVLPTEAEAIQAGAKHIARSLAAFAEASSRDRVDWATTGGSAAPGLYRHLSEPPLRDGVPWRKVHVWWGDDRFVPREHPLSNAKPLDDILLDIGRASGGEVGGHAGGVGIPVANLHPFRTSEAIGAGRDAASTAQQLATELSDNDLDVVDGFPVLDLVSVGVGPDGHVLSVFPGSAAFDSTDWAMAIPAPDHVEPHVERVTMHPSVVRVARDVLVVATGEAKAGILGQIFTADRDERRWPGQVALHERATWILDEAAAVHVPR